MRQVGHLLKLYQDARSAKHQNLRFIIDHPRDVVGVERATAFPVPPCLRKKNVQKLNKI